MFYFTISVNIITFSSIAFHDKMHPILGARLLVLHNDILIGCFTLFLYDVHRCVIKILMQSPNETDYH